MAIDERVANEKQAYNDGDVFAASAALQRRFHHVFSCPNSLRLERYLEDAIKRCSTGKDVLNIGCYEGDEAPTFRKYGARSIVGIDISDNAIAVARRKHGDIAEFHAMDAHRTGFASQSFDLVVGRSILHHLDFELALREVSRVLRPGGAAIFMEPLGDNPGAKLIRALTPRARTKDERALSGAQISWADRHFGGEAHLFGNLFSVPVGMLTSLTPLAPGNFLLRIADKVDYFVSATPIRTWMRFAVLCWQQRAVPGA
jgi:ubiquinone/menaquinone biosynthesis C-methylase UbiE